MTYDAIYFKLFITYKGEVRITSSENKDYELDIEQFEAWVEDHMQESEVKTELTDEIAIEEESEEEDVLTRFRGDSTNRGFISRENEFSIITKLLGIIIVIVVLLMAMVKLRASPVVVVGISMEPTLYDGDILRTKEIFEPKDITYDTIICCTKDNTMIIKRVVGLPGDQISFKDGYVYINGIKREDEFPQMLEYPKEVIQLKEDEYYCLGDNRNNSRDSRYYGPIKFDEITNIVLANISDSKRHYDEVMKTMDYMHSLTDATPMDASSSDAGE